MISYRDKTFCPAEYCAKFNECPRALTAEVKKSAEQWWRGKNPPISQFENPKKLDCYSAKVPTNE